MVKIWNITGEVILDTSDEKDELVQINDDLPVLEGLVRTALFHPLEKMRNSGLLRLQAASKFGDKTGIGKVLAGFVEEKKVYARIETPSGYVEDRYLFDVPKEVYGVENPVAYKFIVNATTAPFGPSGNAA